MSLSRRSFMKTGAVTLAATGSMAQVIASASPAIAQGRRRPFDGYGALVPDPQGIIDLPSGFQYRIISREGDPMTRGGNVPSLHDGMAAFRAGIFGNWLVRNHEVDVDDVEEDGLAPVPEVPGVHYDPEGTGGTTTLLVRHDRRLL